MSKEATGDLALRREHDSVDDFEHLEHEASPLQEGQSRVQELLNIDKSVDFESGVPATPPPSADSEKYNAAQLSDPFQALNAEMADPKAATMAFMETERSPGNLAPAPLQEFDPKTLVNAALEKVGLDGEKDRKGSEASGAGDKGLEEGPATKSAQERGVDTERGSGKVEDPAPPPVPPNSNEENLDETKEFLGDIKSSVLPAPEKSPTIDFLADERSEKPRNIMDDDSWNVVEKPAREPAGLGSAALLQPEKPAVPHSDKFEMSHDFVFAEAGKAGKQVGETETGESEFESEPEPSPAKVSQAATRQQERAGESVEKVRPRAPPPPPTAAATARPRPDEIEIAPKQIFKDMGIDAWFNPERLNPKVAALIYWRDPKNSGIVFGAIIGVLLSLAYFSLISVLAYLSLLVLIGTVVFRIYKTVLQAVQKTSDGHPFKDILDLDLALPADKVHEVADVAVAHINAAVSELRRLFLVEDFVDSVKFGVLLWCLTYVGAWFNGMTLIIIDVVALFTLPKVYEANKAQIDQNLALVQGKISELTAKVKAAIPLGKKAEPMKEE